MTAVFPIEASIGTSVPRVERAGHACAGKGTSAGRKLHETRAPRAAALAAVALALLLCWAPGAPARAAETRIDPGRWPQIWTVDRTGHARKRTNGRYGFLDFAWAPGGRRFAALDNSTEWGVAVLTLDGRVLHRFRGGPLGTSRPSWSPDGRRLAFVVVHNGNERDGDNGRLVTVSPAGGHRRVLSHRAVDSPEWSADGRTIFFKHGPAVLYSHTPERWDISQVPSDGGFSHQVVPDIRDFGGVSADRRWLLYTRRERRNDLDAIWVARSDGSDRRRLIGGLLREWFGWAGGGHRVWSLDESGQFDGAALASIDGRRRELPFADNQLAWSPGGVLVAQAVYEPSGRARLETIRPDGTHRKVLARFVRDTAIGNLAWSPDGRTLAFEANTQPPD